MIPLNPSEEPRTRMYIWNNIFFSLGFDVKDYYKVPFYKEFFNCRILFVLFLNFKKKVYRNRVAMPQLMQLLLMICKVFMLMHNLIIPNYLPLAWWSLIIKGTGEYYHIKWFFIVLINNVDRTCLFLLRVWIWIPNKFSFFLVLLMWLKYGDRCPEF